jgi:hypothetical protein
MKTRTLISLLSTLLLLFAFVGCGEESIEVEPEGVTVDEFLESLEDGTIEEVIEEINADSEEAAEEASADLVIPETSDEDDEDNEVEINLEVENPETLFQDYNEDDSHKTEYIPDEEEA